MKRNSLFLWCLVWGIILCFMCISGCRLFTGSEADREDSLEITLPQWPPSENDDLPWPALSRWKITIVNAEEERSFYTAKSTTTISVFTERNKPCSILVQPLTLLPETSGSPRKECSFFKPAGFIYPWKAELSTATWEQGFLANTMQKLFNEGKEQCLPPVDIEYLISTFNWKKAQEVIEKKISESMAAESGISFYNPWLIEYNTILQNLSVSQFKQSLLNNSGCSTIPLSVLREKKPEILTRSQNQILSSFVIENQSITKKQLLTVRKNTPELFSVGQNFGIIIEYKSLKNISLEFIYLPIYIEDI